MIEHAPTPEPTKLSPKAQIALWVGVVVAAVVITSLINVVSSDTPTPAPVPIKITDTTSCDWAVKAFDEKDAAKVRAISDYVAETMAAREIEIGGKMIARLSKEGWERLRVLPIGLCDKYRTHALHEETLKAYDTMDGMQKAIGAD